MRRLHRRRRDCWNGECLRRRTVRESATEHRSKGDRCRADTNERRSPGAMHSARAQFGLADGVGNHGFVEQRAE